MAAKGFFSDISLSAIIAGFVTVLVGFTSSAVIVFQAAQALNASPAEIASWMWALGLGMGLTCISLSLRYRAPVVTASGVTLLGIGSAFWGLIAGVMALAIYRSKLPRP
ncbi:MAG: benzoate/H(+) symporter BenE family transporter [Nodosilinea sp.]